MHIFSISDFAPVKQLLRGLRLRHLPLDRSESQRIVIRCKHVFEDALHRYKSRLDFKK